MNNMKKIYILIIIIIAVIILYNIGVTVLQNVNRETYTVTVTDKLRVTYGHIWNTHKYLIFSIDENNVVRVFENTDSMPYLKFNSSDFYAKIEIGGKYTFKAVGYRLTYFSMYKNIIEMKEIE